MTPHSTVALFTPRLVLRPLQPDDIHDFHQLWSDPTVITWGATRTLDESRMRLTEFLTRRVAAVPCSGWCAVVRRSDAAFLGDVVLQPAGWDRNLVEIGWHLLPHAQHQGAATEAAQAMMHHAIDHGIGVVWAAIMPSNTPSQAVATRLGMAHVEDREHAGRPHQIWRTTRRNTWAARRQAPHGHRQPSSSPSPRSSGTGTSRWRLP